MNKILLLAGGLLLFGCNKTAESEKTPGSETHTDTEIAPPMPGVEDSSLGVKPDSLPSAK